MPLISIELDERLDQICGPALRMPPPHTHYPLYEPKDVPQLSSTSRDGLKNPLMADQELNVEVAIDSLTESSRSAWPCR
jgi:hypothetical protein